MMIMFSKRLRAVALALTLTLALAPAASAQHITQDANGRIVPNVGKIGMSPEEQIKLGREAAAQAEKQYPILPANSPITLYVQKLGQKLAAKAPGQQWPFTFKVVNMKEINAFALPGGPIYVNLGTIQAADEAELAGVMAHEISHVVFQHSAREAGKAQWIQLGGALTSVLLGATMGGSTAGQLAQLGVQMGASGVVMKYSRTAETEADLLGSQIMYDAGYNPYSMVEFFDTLAKQGGAGGPQFLSDHPNPGNRAETVGKMIKRFPPKEYARSDSPEFASMKKQAMAMTPMTADQIAKQQKQGGGGTQRTPETVGGVMPTGGSKELAQGNWTMSYPENWQVFGDQSASSLVIAPQSGVSQNAVAYGVTINGVQSQQGLSIDDMTAQVIQNLSRTNADMKQAGSPTRIRVNGVEGRSVDLLASSPIQGERERDWLVTLPKNKNEATVLVFTAPEGDFDKLRPTFEKMLRSFKLK
jgi:Zn-dependent protease with chaperone function